MDMNNIRRLFSQYIPYPLIEVKTIDTTGAGDMYAACILYGLTNGKDLEESGINASNLAAKVVSQKGARLENAKWIAK